MPELAEVEHSRRQWNPGLGQPVRDVIIARPGIRIFRDADPGLLCQLLPGQTLLESEARGKQMLFRFSGDLWLGIHLGMNGELRREEAPAEYVPRKHDHLILHQDERALVFEDRRFFGRVRLHQGGEPPAWWTAIAPSLLSREFTADALGTFLARRKRTPLKALLLMQERFPGVGNWMADEILWRARLHPTTRAGELQAPAETARLFRTVRWVARTAVEVIDDDWRYPAHWLFTHRWEPGGHCPRCRAALERATVGGRTTCWCPRCQPEKEDGRAANLVAVRAKPTSAATVTDRTTTAAVTRPARRGRRPGPHGRARTKAAVATGATAAQAEVTNSKTHR